MSITIAAGKSLTAVPRASLKGAGQENSEEQIRSMARMETLLDGSEPSVRTNGFGGNPLQLIDPACVIWEKRGLLGTTPVLRREDPLTF